MAFNKKDLSANTMTKYNSIAGEMMEAGFSFTLSKVLGNPTLDNTVDLAK